MNRRNLFAIATIAASLAISPSVYAATSIHNPVNAMFGKSKSMKSVKLTLVNDSGSPIEIKAGDNVLKLDAGKPLTVNLPEGTRLTANTTTPSHEAGSIIAEVSSTLDGATVHIK